MTEEIIDAQVQINWTNQTLSSSSKRKRAEIDNEFREEHKEKRQILCSEYVLGSQVTVTLTPSSF